MNRVTKTDKQHPDLQIRPWYKEPWPWVAIAIPGAAVIMGFITLYLALSNPDYLVVEEAQYRDITSELRAQPSPNSDSSEVADTRDDGDGEP